MWSRGSHRTEVDETHRRDAEVAEKLKSRKPLCTLCLYGEIFDCEF
jgi:hypothetical protein